MRGRVSQHIRGNIYGILAVFIALGGTAVATSHVPRNSVGSKSIRYHAVKANDVNPAKVQLRVGGSCSPGQAIRAIGQDGTVTCDSPPASVGDGNTTYTAAPGQGVALTGTSFGLAPCPATQLLKSTGGGNYACAADIDTDTDTDTNSGGTVTSVATGSGLSGGPITSTGTISPDLSVLQHRLTGGCSAGSAITVVDQSGNPGCGIRVVAGRFQAAPNAAGSGNGYTFSCNATPTLCQVTYTAAFATTPATLVLEQSGGSSPSISPTQIDFFVGTLVNGETYHFAAIGN